MNIKGYKHRFPEKYKRYLVTAASLVGYIVIFPLLLINMFRRKELDRAEIKTILIVRNDGIGDFILSFSAMSALRRCFPHADITALVPSWQEEIARASGLFDAIMIPDDKRSGYLSSFPVSKSLFAGMLRMVPALRRSRFDLAIDLRGDIRNRIIIFLSAIPRRIGFDIGGLENLLTHKVHYREGAHETDHFNDLISFCGNSGSDSDFELKIGQEDKDRVHQFLKNNGIIQGDNFLIVIHPISRRPAKEWPKRKYAELSDRLLGIPGTKVIMIGSSEDAGAVREIEHFMKEKPVIAAGSLSLLQTAALLKEVNLFIGNDAAPMHMAAAFKVPVVALFGPTDPKTYGPHGEGHSVIMPGIPCRCYSKKACSDPARFCMNSISVNDVFDHARKYM